MTFKWHRQQQYFTQHLRANLSFRTNLRSVRFLRNDKFADDKNVKNVNGSAVENYYCIRTVLNLTKKQLYYFIFLNDR